MSPSAALANDVFRIFALLTTGLLVVGGAIIAVVRFGFAKDVSQAWDSYRGWLVMIPTIAASLFAGRAVAICFFAIVALVAFIEYARATGLHRDLTMTFTGLAGIVGIAVVTLARDPLTGAHGLYGLFMAVPVFVSAALVLAAILRNRPEGQLKAIALALFGFLYIGWMFGHVAFLANTRNAYGYLLYLLFAVELNDVAAFTCGKLFGRRPLCSNVSPWKTREGALGAVLISAVFPLAVRFALPDFSALECVLAGLIVGVGGHLGDLSISVIKRDVGVKDMGTLIRGHGGVLDRIDSLIYIAPLFFHFYAVRSWTVRHMKNTNWRYDTAKDSGLSFVDRLKQCPREPDPLVYAARVAAALAIRAALRVYNRFDIAGREHLPRDGSFVLVANHASHLDAVALLSALPLRSLHRAYPLAARDYFCANELRFALTAIIANVMLLDRDSKGVEGLTLCQRMLEERHNVLVMFPEGTRSIDGRVGMFRRGIGLLLAGTPYPVVPCYLDGTFRAWPKGALITRPTRVRLAIGEARTYERVERTDAGALHICADLRGAVLALASETWPQTARPISQEAYQ